MINNTTNKVFLGGTCNESTWREDLIKMLTIDWFNPVVEDWTPECMIEERTQRELCSYCLYVITPEMTGVYSIAEVVDDSNKQPSKTIFCIMPEYGSNDFTDGQIKSLVEVGNLVERNGGKYIMNNFIELAEYLNNRR